MFRNAEIFWVSAMLLCFMGLTTAVASPMDDQEDGTDKTSMLGATVRMIASLLGIMSLIAGGVFLLKKFSPYRGLGSGGKYQMTVMSKVSLGPKRYICLVKISDEILVIGITNTNISLLSKMRADEYLAEEGRDAYESPMEGYKDNFRKLLDKIGAWNGRASTAPPL